VVVKRQRLARPCALWRLLAAVVAAGAAAAGCCCCHGHGRCQYHCCHWLQQSFQPHMCLHAHAHRPPLIPQVAMFCAKHIPGVLVQTQGFARGDMGAALHECFLTMDEVMQVGVSVSGWV